MRYQKQGGQGPRREKQRRERGEWIATVRSDPKLAMEQDLGVAAVGMVIFVTGGVIAVAGYHPKWQNIHSNAPAPLLGNIVAGIGLVIAALGIVLLLASVVVWIGGRRRRKQD